VGVAEEAMAEDQTAILPTILWLQLLLVSLVAVVWSALRWGVLQTWIVGLPLVLAALWGLSSSASQLLPNLM
jgi:sortase A